eukprot:scaffold3398_cov84-Skeletonema_dohrnii-CCMP3373.AAC.5
MAADGWHVYNGQEAVPHGVTRVRIHESLTVIPEDAFQWNRYIEELECHFGVKSVGGWAFAGCPSLRIVIMRGVEVVEDEAFQYCGALTDVECDKLEAIERGAFRGCDSLTSINLPSAEFVEWGAFTGCTALTNVKFGKELESIGRAAFYRCKSLERITIPLKDNIITADDTFQMCENLKHVDLVEGEQLRDTIDALLLEEWRNDMDVEIVAINNILSTTHAGNLDDGGGKAEAVQLWIRSVLHKIIDYKAQHRSLLNEVASLQQAFPKDLVLNNILPFLELPSHTFEGEVYGEEEEEGDVNEFCRSVAVVKIS